MKKRLFGILLSLALMLTMMPVLGLTQKVYATDPQYVFTFSANGRTTTPYTEGVSLSERLDCNYLGMGKLDQIIRYLYNKDEGQCVQEAPTF